MAHPNLNENIQVDTSDEDSIFDVESIADTNLSIASSVRDYPYENGRRYHAYRHGQYPMPNDEQEQDRLDTMHHFFKLLTRGPLFFAPITQVHQPERILDIGTGTGQWALEMAEEFPEAEVVGTDLSPIQPTWAPSNCKFFIDDAESEWAFPPREAFDFIHGRVLAGGIGDWKRLLKQAYNHLKPGGWVEFQEYEIKFTSDDGTHVLAPMIIDWGEKMDEVSEKFGKPMNIATDLGGIVQEVGFTNVTDDVYKAPLGTWPKDRQFKELGRVAQKIVVEGIEPYTLALFTRIIGRSREETEEYMDKVRQDLDTKSRAAHIYGRVHFIYGQKPMDG